MAKNVTSTTAPTERKISGLGWVRDLPDPRDQLYSAPLPVLKALPAAVDLKPEFPIYDQGRIGSCTANALAGAVQFDRLKSKQMPDFVPSRLFIYYNERKIEGHVANDAGAQIRDGIRTLQKQGACPEAEWPYDDTPAAYDGGPFPKNSKPATPPKKACYDDASKYVITSYQRLTPILNQLRGCLAAGYPFVFGFTVFDSWYSQNPRPATIPLPGANDSAIGGHAVMCVGYDNATSLFKIRNSWGASVGKKGYFFMPYAYLTDGSMASDFWVINAVKA
ncbi:MULTISPECIES: C1 family peptidase [unclassified Mesorhizobium]|uniref:C1 family peptidase n=1 Tax=unclassified Mesorhizobium TaxID=325217 RepID=UPI00112ECBD7|nr:MULTISPECIES: C1 family peptidase [unclassified Mesorhizobium]TPN43745.1 peptidase [Mesorhizobium sp. B1-1-7]TPN46286.1 peptidase [Mesorhizobium sp. B1-1-9]